MSNTPGLKSCGLISSSFPKDSDFIQISLTLPNVNFTYFPSEFAAEHVILITVVRKYLNIFPPQLLLQQILH